MTSPERDNRYDRLTRLIPWADYRPIPGSAAGPGAKRGGRSNSGKAGRSRDRFNEAATRRTSGQPTDPHGSVGHRYETRQNRRAPLRFTPTTVPAERPSAPPPSSSDDLPGQSGVKPVPLLDPPSPRTTSSPPGGAKSHPDRCRAQATELHLTAREPTPWRGIQPGQPQVLPFRPR